MRKNLDHLDPLGRYTEAAQSAANQIIESYSTSFGTATRLLGPRLRTHIRNIYALVRVADELVDGVASQAGLDAKQQHQALDAFQEQTNAAVATGFSSNPIIHAFAHTARTVGIGPDLTDPFFESMRTDLPALDGSDPEPSDEPRLFGAADHADYVYGSAEVIGLMCLQAFVHQRTYSEEELGTLTKGAQQLGAAFQNVNFLRDLSDDTDRLGRSYLSESGQIDAAQKDLWVATIREQISDAEATLDLLPSDARVAVETALRLFERLTDRVDQASTEDLYSTRVRVPGFEKVWLTLRASANFRKGRRA